MKTTTVRYVLLFLGVIALGAAPPSSPRGAKRVFDDVTAAALEKRMPSDIEKRMQVYEQARDDRRELIGALKILVRELKEEPLQQISSSRVCYAVRMLGLIRADEATSFLMDIIDIRFAGGHRGEPRPVQDADVIRALARIGKPASKAAIEYLAKDKSSKRAARYLRVVYLVEGPEVGRFMLQQAAKRQSDPERKARLERALAMFTAADKPVR